MKRGHVTVRRSQKSHTVTSHGWQNGLRNLRTLYIPLWLAWKNRTRRKKKGKDAQKTQFHQNKIPSYASITTCHIKDGAAGKTSHDRWHAKPGRILSVLRRVWITERGIGEETEVHGGRKGWEDNGKEWILTSNKDKTEGKGKWGLGKDKIETRY